MGVVCRAMPDLIRRMGGVPAGADKRRAGATGAGLSQESRLCLSNGFPEEFVQVDSSNLVNESCDRHRL